VGWRRYAGVGPTKAGSNGRRNLLVAGMLYGGRTTKEIVDIEDCSVGFHFVQASM
jgi:hypothetical protein